MSSLLHQEAPCCDYQIGNAPASPLFCCGATTIIVGLSDSVKPSTFRSRGIASKIHWLCRDNLALKPRAPVIP